MDDLIRLVSRRVGLTPMQAEAAVAVVLEHLTARLPSPVVGRIYELLRGTDPGVPVPQNPDAADAGSDPEKRPP